MFSTGPSEVDDTALFSRMFCELNFLLILWKEKLLGICTYILKLFPTAKQVFFYFLIYI